MQYFEQELKNELQYFEKTQSHINANLDKTFERNDQSRGNLLESGKKMWDNTAHSSDDFDSVIEMSQYQEELNIKKVFHIAETNEIQKLKNLQNSPYFARVDFCKLNSDKVQNIYIGRYSLIDDDTRQIYVYDWRSPIASIFYQYELGDVQYEAPIGTIHGTVSLKRQYEIKHGKFEYFFDANVQIVDEFLRKLLSQNASLKMTSIVETIQKDQDIIIRDSKNELLMVQGVAGSGKTSVALHRVAYLMYQGLSSKLSSNNIVILSPNALFAKYISNVLPELGENNVDTLSFEEICAEVLRGDFEMLQTRNQFFEELITCPQDNKKDLIKSSMEFKTSSVFVTILSRFASYCERKLIPFADVYYNQKQLFDRQYIKSKFFQNDRGLPAAVRLLKIESMILQKVREESKSRHIKLEHFAENYPEHISELHEFARMLSIRENKILLNYIHKFTQLDCAALYRKMMSDKNLFYTLGEGLKLPDNIEEIRQQTNNLLSKQASRYEDALAVTFLKIKLCGCDYYKNIKQVVIDEAQDYYPLHFKILNMLFSKAKYTVLGDINQTIEKETTLTFYQNIERILDKKTSALLTLSKSFRCTNQIIAFSQKFIDINQECFSRDGLPPEIFSAVSQEELDEQLKEFIKSLMAEDFKSICILCKSQKASKELFDRIKDTSNVVLMNDTYMTKLSGTFITPIYMAKGLEFDAAIIYGADDDNYSTEDDKKLLYIASTRALHRLALFYTGSKSRFLTENDKEGADDNN